MLFGLGPEQHLVYQQLSVSLRQELHDCAARCLIKCEGQWLPLALLCAYRELALFLTVEMPGIQTFSPSFW